MRVSLFLLLFALGCGGTEPKKYITVRMATGMTTTYVDCDSVDMVSTTEATLYIKGRATKVYSEQITISNSWY